MNEWHRALRKAITAGYDRPDRTGVGTLATFGEQLHFDNRLDVFPAVTTKKLAFKPMAAELACFLKGAESLKEFHEMGCHIWDGNGIAGYWTPRARFEGDLGRIYGVQWRDWMSVDHSQSTYEGLHATKVVDQLKELVEGMKRDPFGRRHLVSAWNPGELDVMCLPPCHVLFQAFVRPGDKKDGPHVVDLRVDMRSVDLFLGLPFDVASYALLQKLLAKELGYESGWLTFHLGDAHVYKNHVAQVHTVLEREEFPPPTLVLDDRATIFDFHPDQARLVDYLSHPAVPAPLNV